MMEEEEEEEEEEKGAQMKWKHGRHATGRSRLALIITRPVNGTKTTYLLPHWHRPATVPRTVSTLLLFCPQLSWRLLLVSRRAAAASLLRLRPSSVTKAPALDAKGFRSEVRGIVLSGLVFLVFARSLSLFFFFNIQCFRKFGRLPFTLLRFVPEAFFKIFRLNVANIQVSQCSQCFLTGLWRSTWLCSSSSPLPTRVLTGSSKRCRCVGFFVFFWDSQRQYF